VGESGSKTLIIDTYPPIFGGNMLILGSSVITPDKTGLVRIVSGAEVSMVMSFKGGVTEGKINSGDQEFDLEKILGSNLWITKLKFDKSGGKKLTLKAVDGAGNENETELDSMFVEEPGMITEKKSEKAIAGANLEVHFFDQTSQRWTLWDATAFGQENPQATNQDGSYSFFLPPGKYYLEVNSPGYKIARSEILELSDNTVINFDFTLSSRPSLTLNLPIFGKVILTLPSFTPPETYSASELSKDRAFFSSSRVSLKLGQFLPNFTLPDSDGFLISGAQFTGKELLISFLSPWSTQSLEQVRVINETHLELSKREEILAVFVQESPGALETFMRRGNYEFNAISDERGNVAQSQFKVTTLPQHFFVDRTGTIQEIVTGLMSKQEIFERLEGLK